jgi:hypothetical protein
MKNSTQESKEAKKWVSFFRLNTRIGSENETKRKKYFNETDGRTLNQTLPGGE